MAEQYQDPSANTAQFQAFAQRTEPEPAARSSSRLLLIVVVLAAVVVLGVILAFLISS